jgi:hypothetical protein
MRVTWGFHPICKNSIKCCYSLSALYRITLEKNGDFFLKTVKIDGGFFIGAVICLGSCIFTCNFVLLGTPVPTAESSLWEILMYFAKLVSGISITAAQIFGLKKL